MSRGLLSNCVGWSRQCILKQKFKLIDRKIDNKLLPKIGLFVASFSSFIMNLDNDLRRIKITWMKYIIGRMRVRRYTENTLVVKVE